MEQADILKISMTVAEARAQLAQLPEDHRARQMPDGIAIRASHENLTPAQAQAILVLAWNTILDWSVLSYVEPKDRSRRL